MSDYVTLLGSDDVRNGGHAAAEAGRSMQSAAGQFEDSLQRQRIFMDDWLARFEQVVEKLASTTKENPNEQA